MGKRPTSVGKLSEETPRGSALFNRVAPTREYSPPCSRAWKPKFLMRTHHIPSSGVDPFVGKRVQFDCELKRPWRRYTCPSQQENFILITQKRNYKVYTDIGLDKDLLTRLLTVLDTGAGPNFIRISELGPIDQEQIRYGPLPDIEDANRNAVRTLGPVKLLVRLGQFLMKVAFIVCKSLAAPVVLGCPREQSQPTEEQRDPDKLVEELVLENVLKGYKERIKKMLQRAGPRTRQIEEENISEMLEAGVIEAAQSAWASPVVLVPKPDGSLQFCVDYRKLYAVTIRDTYPLPRMDECIYGLGNSNEFKTLDTNNGYWQSHIAAPLDALLRKRQPATLEKFGPAEHEAFNSLKTKLVTAPILALPKPNVPYSLDTDPSEYQVVCALFQTHPDGQRKPTGYWSRTLNAAEKNYSVSEKECRAVVRGLTTLRPYLQGETLTIHTDHSSLRWSLSMTDSSERLTRWRLRLYEFYFKVKYKKGLANIQADAFSRSETSGKPQEEFDDNLPCFSMEMENDETKLEDQEDEGNISQWDPFMATRVTESPDQIERISINELLNEKLIDNFCAAIRSRLKEGRSCSFRSIPEVYFSHMSRSMIRSWFHKLWRVVFSTGPITRSSLDTQEEQSC
ncbi:unnamed protein product [Agarophyton chilense]